MSEVEVIVQRNIIIFLREPPKEVIEKLKELGVEFQVKVYPCG